MSANRHVEQDVYVSDLAARGVPVDENTSHKTSESADSNTFADLIDNQGIQLHGQRRQRATIGRVQVLSDYQHVLPSLVFARLEDISPRQ